MKCSQAKNLHNYITCHEIKYDERTGGFGLPVLSCIQKLI